MARSRNPRRRREERAARLNPLFADPGLVHAAHDAFAIAERPGSSAWPYVASVSAQTVSLRWAGASVPEPSAPWRSGFDPRVWVADRAAVPDSASTGARGTAALIGWFDDTLVFVNTARTQGPLAVDGDDEEAELLRELITLQTRPWTRPPTQPQPQTALGEARIWWPMRVEQHAIQLFGLAVARTFDQDGVRQAVELLQAAAALDRVPAALPAAPVPVSAVPMSVPRTVDRAKNEDRANAETENWLRQVQAAAHEARRTAQPIQATETVLPDDAGQPGPEPLLLPGTPVITSAAATVDGP